MANPKTSYARLAERTAEIKRLSSIAALLQWDQETQMPAKAGQARADHLALMSGLTHDRLVSADVGQWLGELRSPEGLSEDEQVVVREVRRAYERESKLPTEHVQELAKILSLAHEAWVEAREKNDFGMFAPWLEKIITLRKRSAALINGAGDKATGAALYDTLLDEYEPGAKSEEIAVVFAALRKELVPLVAKIAASPTKAEAIPGSYPTARQREFGLEVIKSMGFDLDAGRLDVAAHPFCTSFAPTDVRLTTRYREDDFRTSLFGTMHEAGHGLYEQALEAQTAYTPLSEAVSMGIHESQSRLWENLVGRSKPFWQHWYPKIQKAFPEALGGVAFDRFFLSVNVVRPSLIRVEADEVTYNLHILLRFELEREIFSNRLSVNELPKAWNSKMEEYLGVRPTRDADGVLQDIHWSMGAFGYFPTYTLGNLYSAQLFGAARREISGLDAKIGRGELLPLREWLREKVHRHGMRYRPDELCRRATGSGLEARHFTDHLKEKFGEIYAL